MAEYQIKKLILTKIKIFKSTLKFKLKYLTNLYDHMD